MRTKADREESKKSDEGRAESVGEVIGSSFILLIFGAKLFFQNINGNQRKYTDS